MSQIPLNLVSKLNYSDKNFYIHAGITELLTKVLNGVYSESFFVAFIQGAKRFGKTHLAVKLAMMLNDDGYMVNFISGQDLSEKLKVLDNYSEKTVFVVDDIQDYLSNISSGDSGPLVNCIEKLRQANAKFICTSSRSLEEFRLDQHLLSRLNPALGYQIESPAEGDILNLLYHLARQRGLELDEAELNFLVKRVSYAIPAIEEVLEKIKHLVKNTGMKVSLNTLGKAF